MKKKLFIPLLFIFLFVFACSESTNVFEPEVSSTKIDFPFESRENGKFTAIYQNKTQESISYSLVLVSKVGSVLENSNNLDFCEGVNALRSNKVILEWTVLNLNYSIIPNSKIENINDNPNLVSYNLPKGTYIVMLMDQETCTNDSYSIFDITEMSDN